MLRWYFTVITRWIGIVVVLFLWQHVDAQEHEPTSPAEASQGGMVRRGIAGWWFR